MRRIAPLLAVLCASSPHLALAAKAAPPPTWPGGATFCATSEQIRTLWPQAREAADSVLEVQLRHFGVDGFAQVIFEEDKVISIRFRALQKADDYLADANVKGILAGADALIAAPGQHDATRKRWTWKTDDGKEVNLKSAAGTIYFDATVDIRACGGGGPTMGGQTEQEKKDLDASTRKRAVDFDPMAEDIEEEEEKAREAERKKKEEERKAREEKTKKDDDKLDDKDVDW